MSPKEEIALEYRIIRYIEAGCLLPKDTVEEALQNLPMLLTSDIEIVRKLGRNLAKKERSHER